MVVLRGRGQLHRQRRRRPCLNRLHRERDRRRRRGIGGVAGRAPARNARVDHLRQLHAVAGRVAERTSLRRGNVAGRKGGKPPRERDRRVALVARGTGYHVIRALADRIDVVVALRTGARHHVRVGEMRSLERVRRVAGIAGLRRRNVVGRHEHGRPGVALNVALAALAGRSLEDAIQVALLAAQVQVLSVERESGGHVVELAVVDLLRKGGLRGRAQQRQHSDHQQVRRSDAAAAGE